METYEMFWKVNLDDLEALFFKKVNNLFSEYNNVGPFEMKFNLTRADKSHHLSLHIEMKELPKTYHSIKVNMKLGIVSTESDDEIEALREIKQIYTRHDSSWGHTHFLDWNKINKYVKVDTKQVTFWCTIRNYYTHHDDSRTLRAIYDMLTQGISGDSPSPPPTHDAAPPLVTETTTTTEQKGPVSSFVYEHPIVKWEATVEKLNRELGETKNKCEEWSTKHKNIDTTLKLTMEENQKLKQEVSSLKVAKNEVEQEKYLIQKQLDDSGIVTKKRKLDKTQGAIAVSNHLQILAELPIENIDRTSMRDTQECLQKLLARCTEALNVMEKCSICKEARIDTILLPCGHNQFCFDCASQIIEKCPTCRDPISARTKCYL